MLHALVPHLSLIATVKAIGYPGLFAAVFLESGVFFGFFLPGGSLLFTAGLLASHGFFNIWVLIPLLTLAAILGDSTGYWFGATVGIALFLRPDSKLFKHEHIEAAKDFFDRHGAFAIFLARFVPIVRTFAPIVAGVVRMRYRTFLFYNVLGAVTWGVGLTVLGYYLGHRFPLAGRAFGIAIAVIVIVTTVPIFWHAYKQWRKAL